SSSFRWRGRSADHLLPLAARTHGERSVNPSETLAPPRTEVRIGALNAEEIAAISKRVKEPEFLARRRAAAWAHCEKTPFPPRTEELWRRTDISSLKWDGILAAPLESGGAFVYVPDHVKVPRPIQLLFSRQTPDLGTFPHVVLALAPGADAAIIEEYVSHGEPGQGVNVGATEVTLAQGAKLH